MKMTKSLMLVLFVGMFSGAKVLGIGANFTYRDGLTALITNNNDVPVPAMITFIDSQGKPVMAVNEDIAAGEVGRSSLSERPDLKLKAISIGDARKAGHGGQIKYNADTGLFEVDNSLNNRPLRWVTILKVPSRATSGKVEEVKKEIIVEKGSKKTLKVSPSEKIKTISIVEEGTSLAEKGERRSPERTSSSWVSPTAPVSPRSAQNLGGSRGMRIIEDDKTRIGQRKDYGDVKGDIKF